MFGEAAVEIGEHRAHLRLRHRAFHHHHQRRLVGGGADQAPGAVLQGHAHTIDGDKTNDLLAQNGFARLLQRFIFLRHRGDDIVFFIVGAEWRHGRRAPGFGQAGNQRRHFRLPGAVQHFEDRNRRHDAIVIPAADRRIEKVMAAFFETGDRTKLMRAPLHVGMAGLPVIDRRTVLLQHRIDFENAGRFHIGDEFRIRNARRKIARQQNAHLVGKNFFSVIGHHAATVAIAIEAERKLRPGLLHHLGHRMQHLHVFGVGIVFGEGEIQLRIHRDHLCPDAGKCLRRKGARRAVAAGRHHPDRAGEFVPVRDRREITRAHVFGTGIAAAGARFGEAAEHDRFQPRHLIRPEGQRFRGAHLHPGPAIFVVAGGDHGNARTIERELRVISHRRGGKADIHHLTSRLHQPDGQRLFDGKRIGAVIVPGGDAGRDAQFVKQGAEAEAQRLHPRQIQFRPEQPARVIFPEAIGGDERQILVIQGIGLQIGAGFGHGVAFEPSKNRWGSPGQVLDMLGIRRGRDIL